MPDSDVPRIMDEKITETGCRVRVVAYREGEYSLIEGVYLDLRVTGEADERRAELRMTAEEARWLAEALVGRAGEIHE